ncbi:MAG TPA: carboxylating nicotinate-nucleotide diphosphorylase [Smithellaceae bacterium]|jgi:nicotinate-nucleotide pyrophosphorylase (carboxylating)|nr:carboxylating nicotinate-nucleotide diphosphorylase [Syntrophaceae bacterium]HNV56292.1 carboxylating nicotinate-nucleotide diphosphorylase [Smithellaceae bacterium]MBP9532459.1 carboxylating nicotinate-nucleotide diphosphorylase [Syntrophaceae bacterium]HNY95755.1 carboxylating nicotinate-nucleotide diphosphorylase [Smithellaceae bacterium]HOD63982.1 carboxylating nicotinate-nucleotide diphosphorylase [Smithellaceae bacterium]
MIDSRIQKIIRAALAEDIGTGDITTQATVSPKKKGRAVAVAKENFVVAGLEVFEAVFQCLDPDIVVRKVVADGSRVRKGAVLARVEGRLSAILQAERTALNFFQRMCGIATLTAAYVDAVGKTKAKIYDTRKTVPGLRALDKMAVRQGGGTNHRFGLFDAVLIKDNHIEAAGGIAAAVAARKKHWKRSFKIEVETKNLREVKEALVCGADIIMLDNMTIHAMKKAVDWVAGRAFIEASGNVTLKRVREIASTGVDGISVGALTHSVRAADISLKITG